MSSPLADHLRTLPDDRLTALIRLRPDLIVPVPGDIAALAHRAQTRVSVARALDGLDRFTLQILDALRYTRDEQTTSVQNVLTLTTPAGLQAARVRSAIEQLMTLLVVYGPDDALRIVGAVDEVAAPYPAGLGRPAQVLDPLAAALVADPAGLRRTLLAAPPAARAVLDRLAADGPVGAVSPSSLTEGTESPVRWLVDAHLLVVLTNDSVELPREVALLLRRDTGPLGALYPDPPSLASPALDLAVVDRAGAGQVLEVVRHTRALLEAAAADPPGVLRSGGLGVRDLRRLARAVNVDEATAGVLLEVATAASLLGEAPVSADGGDMVFLPTSGYDGWRASGIAVRWHRLVLAWLSMTRAPAMIGQRDERDRLFNALSPEVTRPSAPAARRAALDVLLDLPAGCAPGPADVVATLAWRAPRRAGRGAVTATVEALDEAARLGLTGSGALTSYGRLVLAETAAPPAEDDPLGLHEDLPLTGAVGALDALLPPPVDHVLLQADLTLVVPGPPEPLLVSELALVATPESASVYRVTAGSIRRGLDAGYSAADLHALFAHRSRTPVPQTLTYLIDDVARRHGGLRVGSTGCYVRSDDEALIAEVLVDRRLSTLLLRRLAPTVLASRLAVGQVLAALREAGYPPVQEDAAGAAVLARPKSRRAAPRPSYWNRPADEPAASRLTGPRLAGVIEQIRRGEAAARAARRAPATVRPAGGPSAAHIEALEVLQQAVRDRVRVWVGYVDAHGTPTSRLLRPVSIGSGYLRAEDERTETLHTLALHRITAAVLDDD